MPEKLIHPSYGCARCLAILDWNLIGACASVGIERKKTTQQMVSDFMAAYHTEHDDA